mgnify:CR=1 FL=1
MKITLILAILCFVSSGCAGSKSAGPEQSFRGTIKYVDLEGGFYGIIDDSGARYRPLNLMPEYRKDSLAVEGSGFIRDDVVSFHMWGRPLSIKEIDEVKRKKGTHRTGM